MEVAQCARPSHERAVLACWYHYTMTGLIRQKYASKRWPVHRKYPGRICCVSDDVAWAFLFSGPIHSSTEGHMKEFLFDNSCSPAPFHPCSSASFIAAICAGVLPQQAPM